MPNQYHGYFTYRVDCFDCRFHSFSWHGTDPSNKTQLIPNASQFQKLQIIPGNFYYNVRQVYSHIQHQHIQ